MDTRARPSLNTHPDPFLRRIRWITIALIAMLVVWQFLPWVERWFARLDAEPRVVAARGELAADEQATIEIFERTSPAVVFITTRQRVVDLYTRNVFSVPRGTGSGFFWDDLGHIVTNNHVIEGASEATIRLNDGRSYRAVLVGRSKAHDLAVLRINVPFDPRPPVPIGTSADLKVGQKVFAIGNPFGLDYTLTSGLVSALDRSLSEENGTTIEHLIQTDAAINPGNSGGALVDSAGSLVGINTAIYSRSGGSLGIGFAIPVSIARDVLEQIVATGEVVRGWVGVEIQDLTPELAASFGYRDASGALIAGVLRGSPADRAGVRPGDVLVALDGETVRDPRAMLDMVAALPPGKRAAFRVRRGAEELDLDVEVGRRPVPQGAR